MLVGVTAVFRCSSSNYVELFKYWQYASQHVGRLLRVPTSPTRLGIVRYAMLQLCLPLGLISAPGLGWASYMFHIDSG